MPKKRLGAEQIVMKLYSSKPFAAKSTGGNCTTGCTPAAGSSLHGSTRQYAPVHASTKSVVFSMLSRLLTGAFRHELPRTDVFS